MQKHQQNRHFFTIFFPIFFLFFVWYLITCYYNLWLSVLFLLLFFIHNSCLLIQGEESGKRKILEETIKYEKKQKELSKN